MQRLRRHILGVPWPDAVVAGVLVVAAVVTTALDTHVLHPVTEIVSAVLAGSLVLRTRAPLIMAVIASAACVTLALLPGAQTPLWSFVTLLVLAFSIAAHLHGIHAIVGLVLLLAATFVIEVATSSSTVELLLTPIILVGAPALAGWLLARARAQADRLQRLTAELAAERERGAHLAAQAERSRIARDLHDILAHTLSSIAVQAGAAQQLLPQTDPARQPVEHIMTATHEALDEVRSLLATTRPDVPEDTDPRLGLDRLPDLATADGVELSVIGKPAPVQPGVSLAAFRIVQEALTNARRHATGLPVFVTVRYDTDALRLEIRNGMSSNAPPQRPGGHGIIGMAERAAAYAGTVSTSRSAAGEWVVTATLPYSGARDDEAVAR